jgi:predicted transcriptional regulator
LSIISQIISNILMMSRPGVANLPFRKLSVTEAGNLTKPFSVEEVKQAVWDCDSFKSLGPDVLTLDS